MIQPRVAKTGADTRLVLIRDAVTEATDELARIDAILEASEARIAALSAMCASYHERHEADELRRVALESERDALAALAGLVVQDQTHAVQSELDTACEALQRVHESPVWRLKRGLDRLLGRAPRTDDR